MGGKRFELPAGWTSEARIRKTGKRAGAVDVYYYAPDGSKYRSAVEVRAALAIGHAPGIPLRSAFFPCDNASTQKHLGTTSSKTCTSTPTRALTPAPAATSTQANSVPTLVEFLQLLPMPETSSTAGGLLADERRKRVHGYRKLRRNTALCGTSVLKDGMSSEGEFDDVGGALDDCEGEALDDLSGAAACLVDLKDEDCEAKIHGAAVEDGMGSSFDGKSGVVEKGNSDVGVVPESGVDVPGWIADSMRVVDACNARNISTALDSCKMTRTTSVKLECETRADMDDDEAARDLVGVISLCGDGTAAELTTRMDVDLAADVAHDGSRLLTPSRCTPAARSSSRRLSFNTEIASVVAVESHTRLFAKQEAANTPTTCARVFDQEWLTQHHESLPNHHPPPLTPPYEDNSLLPPPPPPPLDAGVGALWEMAKMKPEQSNLGSKRWPSFLTTSRPVAVYPGDEVDVHVAFTDCHLYLASGPRHLCDRGCYFATFHPARRIRAVDPHARLPIPTEAAAGRGVGRKVHAPSTRSRHFSPSSPFSSPGQSASAEWRRAAPPVSPFGLLEELLWDDPWALLLAAFFLALSRRRQVDAVLFRLRSRFPRAEDAAQACERQLADLLAPLQVSERRLEELLAPCLDDDQHPVLEHHFHSMAAGGSVGCASPPAKRKRRSEGCQRGATCHKPHGSPPSSAEAGTRAVLATAGGRLAVAVKRFSRHFVEKWGWWAPPGHLYTAHNNKAASDAHALFCEGLWQTPHMVQIGFKEAAAAACGASATSAPCTSVISMSAPSTPAPSAAAADSRQSVAAWPSSAPPRLVGASSGALSTSRPTESESPAAPGLGVDRGGTHGGRAEGADSAAAHGLRWYLRWLTERRAGSCSRRGIVVGQAPGKSRCNKPWCCRPLQGLAERRVARLAGLSVEELWMHFQRTNLVDYHPGRKGRSEKHVTTVTGYNLHMGDGDTFPLRDARKAAAALPLREYACAILLGLNVGRAFVQEGMLLGSQVKLFEEVWIDGCLVLVFPHPSGISHFWNVPSNMERAARAIRGVLKKSGLITKSEQEHDCFAVKPIPLLGMEHVGV